MANINNSTLICAISSKPNMTKFKGGSSQKVFFAFDYKQSFNSNYTVGI